MTSAPSPVSRVQRPLALLLRGAIDYAGLFPPASLPMQAAVREYEGQRAGPDAWALGRFVVGVDGLDALVTARNVSQAVAWPLSVLAAGGDAITLRRFAESQHLFIIEALETKAASPAAIAAIAPLAEITPEVYIELPVTDDLPTLLAAVRSLGARAKIRTGGVTPDAIPSAQKLAQFITACVRAGVTFKATAGLHHLVRGEYPLTYAPGSQTGTMFGFLNIFVAAALAWRDTPPTVLEQVLEERDAHAFELQGDGLRWRDTYLTSDELRGTRMSLLASFGSCSFREPIAELHAAFAQT